MEKNCVICGNRFYFWGKINHKLTEPFDICPNPKCFEFGDDEMPREEYRQAYLEVIWAQYVFLGFEDEGYPPLEVK